MPAKLTLTRREAHRLRLHAQLLGVQRGAEVADTVRSAGAIQAQDRLGEQLGIGVRSTGLSAADVDHARLAERTVVRNWLMRGTLHLVPSEDLRWMLELLGEAMDAKALKRRADLGISDDDHARVLAFLREELAANGPMTRAEIGDAFRSAGLPSDGQATPHLLRTTSLLGVSCFGPERDGDATHTLIDDWIPRSDAPPDPGAELARRYFTAYGPATQSDFRWWSGLPAAETRRCLQAALEDLTEVDVDGQAMWMSQDALDRLSDVLEGPHGVLRVLGPFDPYIVGYAKRDLDVPDHLLKRVNAGGGMLRPCVLIDGRLVATWDRRRRAHGLSVRVTCFEELSDDARSQLEAEFDEIGRFLETEISWSLTLDPAAGRAG
ncbi:MAG: winged helix DNA-binding domain-containing protein [Chloroflexota bacterium]|nr:winged helix DNA-binding domain-containing protein [Chloroflexota bacterium]